MSSNDTSIVNTEGCPPGVPFRNNAQVLWGYDIKMGGPATALSLFFLIGTIVMAQLIHARNRNTYYMITLVVAAWAEGGGYSAAVHTVREHCKSDLFDSFLAAQVLILIVPNFVEATMYTTAAKISAFGNVPRQHFWLRPTFVTWFYIVSDIATIVVQAVGVGIWGSARTSDDDDDDSAQQAEAGAWVVVAGLITQIASQSIFFLEVLYIQWRMDRGYARLPETRALFFSNYWIWGFLQIRNIYRLVAFIQRAVASNTDTGGGGAAEIQPVFFIFEALMIVMSVLMFALFPPGYLLPKASARKAEQMDQVVQQGKDVEKSVQDEELPARAEVPECFRRSGMLTAFEYLPWLGRVF